MPAGDQQHGAAVAGEDYTAAAGTVTFAPGWLQPQTGSKVTVVFAGQTKIATADNRGKWMVKLDPLEASSDERELTVTLASGESLICKGVLVGEVWFASGQSNW